MSALAFVLTLVSVCLFILFHRLRRAERLLHTATSELAAIHSQPPIDLLLMDADLRIRRWAGVPPPSGSQTLSEVLGCAQATCQAGDCGHASASGDAPGCGECALRRAVLDTVHKGTRHHDLEVCIQVPSPESLRSRFLLISTVPIPGRQEALVWAQDITRHKEAQESLRKSQARLATALAESEANHSLLAAVFTAQADPILIYGADGTVVRTNPAAHRTWGFDPTGWHHSEVMAKLDVPPESGITLTQKALQGEPTISLELRAGNRVLETSSAPMRDSEGRIIGAVVVPHDVTRRHRMRAALEMMVRDLETALQEKTILLKEVHHRVKNNLAVISSVLAMKADATDIAEARQALEDSQQRVRSIALIHEQLYGHDNLNSINFAEYTEDLLRELTEVLVSEPWRITVQSNLEPIELAVNLAVPCGLILHELVTNAFKHAFPAGRRGEVRVSFRECEPGILEMAVEDNGIGFLPSSPDAHSNSRSLGLRIVHILARQLDGKFQQEPCPGTRFVLRFPASDPRS